MLRSSKSPGWWLAMLLGACAHGPVPPFSAAARMCGAAPRPCVAPSELERELARAPLRVREVRPVGRGLSRAMLLTVDVRGHALRVKWKEATPGADGHNRSPRHELATWALARLVLGDRDDVVPPTAVRCIDRQDHRALFGRAGRPTFEGIGCTLGTLSYWLEDVDELHGLDRQRFATDEDYRAAIARLNLITYLIDHRDAKDANFVITRGRPLRAFAVDNGLAFSGFRTLRGYFAKDWSRLQVDALPRQTLERLRRIGPAELDRLAVLVQLELRHGRLVEVPPEPPFDLDSGVRRRGNRIQLGLTRREIDKVGDRVAHVLALADEGRLSSF